MKKLSKLLLIMFAFSLFMLGNVRDAMAARQEQDLYYNNVKQSIMVTLGFEKDDLKVSFIDPDGKSVTLDSKSVKYFESDRAMFIVIQNAKEGQWKISYDKGSNDTIEADVQPYEEPIWITKLSIGSIKSDGLALKFKADQAQKRGYDYEVYLGTDENMTTKRQIYNGSGTAGEEQNITIPLEGINTYDKYYLQVYVHYEYEGTNYFDEAVSDSFEYKNDQTVAAVGDYKVLVVKSQNSVSVDLTDVMPSDTKGAYVVIKEDDKEIASKYVTDFANPVVMAQYSDDAKKIVCLVSVQYNSGLISEYNEKSFEINGNDKLCSIELPQSGVINAYKYEFSYKNAKDQIITFKLNDEEEAKEITLNGDGSQIMPLTQINNTIDATYVINGITYEEVTTLNVDNIPPTLKIYEDLDGMTTDKDKVTVTGKTEVESKLTINDNEVEIGDNGTFSFDTTLENGVNTVTINSTDDAGNISTYVMKINKSNNSALVGNVVDGDTVDKILAWLPLAIALFTSLFAVIEMIIIASGKKRGTKKRIICKRVLNVLMVFAIITSGTSGALYIIRRRYEKSEEYIQLALDFAKDAYNYLQTTKLVGIICMISGGVAILTIVINILISIIKKGSKKKEKAVKEEVPAQEDTPNEETAKAETEVETEMEAEVEVPEQEEEFKFCKFCGAKLSKDATFCKECGEKLI